MIERLSLRYMSARLPTFVFFCIIGFYAVFWARIGLDTKDGGFILSLSWRILNGEIPYKDFIFVRPPASIYLHSIPLLAGEYGIFADRLFTIAQLAMISLVSSAVTLNCSASGNHRELYWWLSIVIFIFSAHNFPFFGWPTIDGIAFSVLALYALTKNRGFISGLLIILAFASKQNFAAIAILLAIISLFLSTRQLISYLLGTISAFVVLFVWLYYTDTIALFSQQVLGTGTASEVFDAGFINYVNHAASRHFLRAIAGLSVILLFIFWRNTLNKKSPFSAVSAADAFTGLVLITLLQFAYTAIRKSFHEEQYDWFFVQFSGSKTLFIASGLAFVILVYRQYRTSPFDLGYFAARWAPIIALFGIAWTASISWGYKVPALFAAPMIAPLVLMNTSAEIKIRRLRIITYIALPTFAIALAHPYGEGKRVNQLVRVPSELHAASLLWTNGETIDKIRQIKKILEEFDNKPFAVFPSFTNIHLLLNTQSPSLLDWEMNAEIPKSRRFDIVKHLCKKGALVLVEKDHAKQEIADPQPNNINERFYSAPTAEVISRWRLIRDAGEFLVYEPTSEACQILE